MILYYWLSVLNSVVLPSLSWPRSLPYTRRKREVQMALGDLSALFRSSEETGEGQHQNFSFTTSKKEKYLKCTHTHTNAFSLYTVPSDVTKMLGKGRAAILH